MSIFQIESIPLDKDWEMEMSSNLHVIPVVDDKEVIGFCSFAHYNQERIELMNRKRLRLILLLLVIIFLTVSGIYIYKIPYKVVNGYIINYKSDERLYSESISRFLTYNKEKSLPEPIIRLKMINRSMNEAEILASFETFTYGVNNVLTKVYSGNLIFSLVRNKWTWEIDTIAVIKDIES